MLRAHIDAGIFYPHTFTSQLPISVKHSMHYTVIIPATVAVCSQGYPHFPLDGTKRPEWPVPLPASPQTHVVPFDTPDGPAPVLWPY